MGCEWMRRAFFPLHLKLLSVRVLAGALGRPPVPLLAQHSSPSCAASMSSGARGVDNLQLGSRLAAPGQQQLRIEADYVTCTQ